MSDQLTEFLNNYGPKIEDDLLHWLPLSDKPGTEMFNKAVYYAVFPPGKRMRPLFTLLATKTVGGNPEKALPIACAIEYFHTCSLIFDDLPAMDNALERRGRRPTHQVFGEDVAMLAALALLNQGYALTGQIQFPQNQTDMMQRLVTEMAENIGHSGMISGQVVDLRLKESEIKDLRPVSYTKTTALMRLMLTAGAIVGCATEAQLDVLAAFGENLGGAYQILDDIVDELEDHLATKSKTGIDIHALWHDADDKLKKSRLRLMEDLADNQADMLIELSEKIFSRLKAKAAGRLVKDGWFQVPISYDGSCLQPE